MKESDHDELRRHHNGWFDCGICLWLGCIVGCLLLGRWAWAVIMLFVPVVLFAAFCIWGILAAHGATRRHDGPCRKSEGDT